MKKAILVLSAVIMIAVIIFCIYLDDRDVLNSVSFVVEADDSVTQSINLFHKDGKYYAFLPSYADFQNMTITHNADYSIYLNGKPYHNTSSLSDLVVDQEYALTIQNRFGITICKETLIFSKSANIPALSINLIDGTIEDLHKNTDIKKTGTLSLIEADSGIDYIGSFGSISGRGNTTWAQHKKPYTLEFDVDTSLIKMGATKKYTLLANACDESNLRNKIAYDMAKALNVTHCVDSEFVDLYIDGVYYGLYLLAESVTVGKNVVNITDLEQLTTTVNQYPLSKSDAFEKTTDGIYQKGFHIQNNPSDITGGYLVEIEILGRLQHDKSGFITRNDVPFYVKAPSYASSEQVAYISDLFQIVEDSLKDENISEYIDLDSWVRFYLVQEVMANSDISSFYLCKDRDAVNSKIVAGPIWDFDLSLGSGFLGVDLNPEAFYTNLWGWFERIYINPTFRELLKNIYIREMKGIVEELVNSKLDQYCNEIQASYLMNELRWKGIQSYEWCNHYDTLQEHKEYIFNYLMRRTAFLDSAWIDGVKYCRIYYTSGWPVYEKNAVSVEYGQTFGDLPVLSYDGYEFLGYYDKTTGEPYAPGTPITENLSLVAQWKSKSEPAATGIKALILRVLREGYYDFEYYCFLALFCIMSCSIVIAVWIDFRKHRRNRDG